MISKEQAREIVLDAMEEEALLVAGIVTVHRLEDEVLWKLMRGLDTIRRRNLARIADAGEPGPAPDAEGCAGSHPAIEEFLVRLQRDRRQPAQSRP